MISLVFSYQAFSVPESYPGHHNTNNPHVSLASYGLCFSHFPCFWWPWQFWRSTGQVFCKVSINLDLSNVFLLVRLELWVGGGRPQRWSAILTTSHQGYMRSTWLITDDANLDHLADIGFTRFLQWSYISPSHTLLFGNRSLSAAHNQKVGS